MYMGSCNYKVKAPIKNNKNRTKQNKNKNKSSKKLFRNFFSPQQATTRSVLTFTIVHSNNNKKEKKRKKNIYMESTESAECGIYQIS